MTKQIKIAPFGNLLEYQDGYTPLFVKETLEERGLCGLRIFTDAMQNKPKNLDFFKDFTFLEHLSIGTILDYDFGFLKDMPQLKTLSLDAWGKQEIDLSAQHQLKSLKIIWRKNIIGLENCLSLELLGLMEWKEKAIPRIRALKELKTLIIKTASIGNLDDLEPLKKLEHVEVANCRNLISIRGLNKHHLLRHLEVWSCTKIADYKQLDDLPSLETIILNDCKTIASIKFISKFPKLKKLSLAGNTRIEDGDISAAKNLPVFFKNL